MPTRAAFMAALIGASMLSIGVARAETVMFQAKLTGGAEVPATPSKGTGTLMATLDTTTKTLSWTVTYSGLTGPAIGGHFHGPAPAGKNAGVAIPFKGPLASPIKGSTTVTDAQIKELEAGDMYVNLHTAAHTGGEIRGQVEKGM